MNVGRCGSSTRAWRSRLTASVQRGLGDVRVLPHLVEQHLLRDNLAGAVDQAGEHADRARRQRELRAVAIEQTVEPIELEIAEADAVDGQHGTFWMNMRAACSRQGLAEQADRFGERGLGDVRVFPHLVEQHLLRDDLAWAMEQGRRGRRPRAAAARAPRRRGRADG